MDYAAARLEKIRRNEEMLISLGLRTPTPELDLVSSSSSAKKKASNSSDARRHKVVRPVETPPRYVSTRGLLLQASSANKPALESVTELINKQSPISSSSKPWTERDDARMIFLHHVKGLPPSRVAGRMYRLEEDIAERLEAWNVQAHVAQRRAEICRLISVNECRHISPAHLWTQHTRRTELFTTHDLLDFEDLPASEQAMWIVRWGQQRAKFFRQAREARRWLPDAERRELGRLNAVLAAFAAPPPRRRKRNGDEEFDYFCRAIMPQVDALYRRYNTTAVERSSQRPPKLE